MLALCSSFAELARRVVGPFRPGSLRSRRVAALFVSLLDSELSKARWMPPTAFSCDSMKLYIHIQKQFTPLTGGAAL